MLSALVAETIQVAVAVAERVLPLSVQPTPFTESFTAPVPEPPLVESVIEVPNTFVNEVFNIVSVD